MDNSYGCFSTLIAAVVVLLALWLAVTAAVVLAIVAGVVAAVALLWIIVAGDERKAEHSKPSPSRGRRA